MHLLATLRALFRRRPEPEVDRVPVRKSLTARRIAKARADAAKRHGKQFRADEQHPRETAKSRHLQEIEAATSEPTQANVSNLKRTAT